MVVYKVIGSGRSGTSLAMQVIDRLGIESGRDWVPASENNLQGTGEDTEVRDIMLSFQAALGREGGLRPHGWLSGSAAEDARTRLCHYLTSSASKAGTGGFAVKWPSSSLYIPLWQEVAEAVGISLRFLWATRAAPSVLASMQEAYGMRLHVAEGRFMQRVFYTLRDAPDDTLVLPYEGWNNDSEGQVAAIAAWLGVADVSSCEVAAAVFSPTLDHSSQFNPPEVPEVLEQVDSLIVGRRGRLGDLVDRRSPEYFLAMTKLSDRLSAGLAKDGGGNVEEQSEMRLRFLESSGGESRMGNVDVAEHASILRRRIREVERENRRLQRRISEIERGDDDNTVRAEQVLLIAQDRDSKEEELVTLARVKIQKIERREQELRATLEKKKKEVMQLREKIKQIDGEPFSEEASLRVQVALKILWPLIRGRLSAENRELYHKAPSALFKKSKHPLMKVVGNALGLRGG